MTKEIRCDQDLGVADCDLVARSEVPGEIVHQVVKHLREEHDMDMPDPEAIIEGDVDEEDVDEDVWLVVRRLEEELDLAEVVAEAEPSSGDVPSAAPPKQL